MKQRVALESEPFNFLLILPVFFFCLFVWGGFGLNFTQVATSCQLRLWVTGTLSFFSLFQAQSYTERSFLSDSSLWTTPSFHCFSLSLSIPPLYHCLCPRKVRQGEKIPPPCPPLISVSSLAFFLKSYSHEDDHKTWLRLLHPCSSHMSWPKRDRKCGFFSPSLFKSHHSIHNIYPSLNLAQLAIRACQAEPSHNKREAAFRETKDQNKANRSSFSAVKHLFTSSVLCSAHISPFATSQEAILPVCPVPANERQVQLRFVFCFNLRNLCWERKLNLILCLWVLFAAGHRARYDQSSSIFQLSRPKLGNLTEVLRGIFSNEAEKVSRNLWFVFHDVDVRALEVVQRRWPSLAAWVLVTSSCQWWFPPNVTAMNCRLPLSCSWFSQTTLINIWLDLNFGFNRNKSSLSLLIKGWLYFIHWDYFITESRATTLKFKWSSNSLVGLWRWFWVSFFAGLRNHISKNLTEAQLKVRLLGFQSCHHMFQVVHCYLISAIIGLLHLFNRLLPSIMAVLCQKKDFLVFKLF